LAIPRNRANQHRRRWLRRERTTLSKRHRPHWGRAKTFSIVAMAIRRKIRQWIGEYYLDSELSDALKGTVQRIVRRIFLWMFNISAHRITGLLDILSMIAPPAPQRRARPRLQWRLDHAPAPVPSPTRSYTRAGLTTLSRSCTLRRACPRAADRQAPLSVASAAPQSLTRQNG
jgi:hypothetical protein